MSIEKYIDIRLALQLLLMAIAVLSERSLDDFPDVVGFVHCVEVDDFRPVCEQILALGGCPLYAEFSHGLVVLALAHFFDKIHRKAYGE